MKQGIVLHFMIFVLLSYGVKAQGLIAVQNGGDPSFYTKLDSAIFHATNGDTIYIPGGIFPWSGPNLSKLLHIIGVGHNPDSNAAVVATHIIGNALFIHSGAEGGSLTGLYLDNNLWFFDNVSNYTVSRCNILNLTFTQPNTASNNVFIENAIRGSRIDCGNAQSSVFYNNIIDGDIIHSSFGVKNKT